MQVLPKQGSHLQQVFPSAPPDSDRLLLPMRSAIVFLVASIMGAWLSFASSAAFIVEAFVLRRRTPREPTSVKPFRVI